jgi:hypothetical protein
MMLTIAYLLLLLSATWLLGVSLFILLRPQLALTYLGKFASTNLINYSELSLRMMAGIAFLQYADASRSPRLFVIVGWFLVVTAGILFCTPRRWHAAYAVYWSRVLTPSLARMAAPFSFLAGVLLLLALH